MSGYDQTHIPTEVAAITQTGIGPRLKELFPERVVCAVSGGRDYTDDKRLISTLDFIHKTVGIELLLEGGCPVGDGGADERARKWAKKNEINCLSVPAKPSKYRWPAAGPKRNAEIGYLLGERRKIGNDALWILFPGGRGTASAREVAAENGITRYEVGYGYGDELIEGWVPSNGEIENLQPAKSLSSERPEPVGGGCPNMAIGDKVSA